MRWRAVVIPILAGVGLGLAACGGDGTAGTGSPWYRDGYEFGAGQQGSPSVQTDSPTQFCNAALRTAAAAPTAGSSGPPADGTKVPRSVPPVSDAAGDGAWLAGCVAGLTSQ